MDLIERLTHDRRPLGTVIHAISRAQQALHTAAGRYTGPALTDPASGDQQQLAAALADAAVIAVLGLHALGRNTAGELAAAADRIDPWGAATRFREADGSGGSGAYPAQANYAQQRRAALAAGPAFRWHHRACPAVLGTGTCTCAERDDAGGDNPAAACPHCQAPGLFAHAMANGWRGCDACGASWALQ